MGKPNLNWQIIVKWILRSANLFVLAFLLYFLIAHLISTEENGNGFQSKEEILFFLFFPLSTVVGLLLAWKHELWGGMLSFFSILFGILLFSPKSLDEMIFFWIALPGLMHIVHALFHKGTKPIDPKA